MSLTNLLAGVAIVALQAGIALDNPDTVSQRVLFRWTDYKGQITYGDRPPPDAQHLIRIDTRYIGEQTQSLLPYLVRRAASNFPVMLFTSKNCSPCATARDYLNKRGVPFAERTIESADDSMEFKRLTGAEGVPVVMLGSKPLIAFDPHEWSNALDATGYPQTSQLPRDFKQEPARPLTQKEKPPAAK
jgi:glutaredoxin